jgi:hypothetical protein
MFRNITLYSLMVNTRICTTHFNTIKLYILLRKFTFEYHMVLKNKHRFCS